MSNAIVWSFSRRNCVASAALRAPSILSLLLLLIGAGVHPAAFASQPFANAKNVTAGGYHVCAIVNGAAQCWGYNGEGQLGNGSFLDSGQPVPVYGLGSGVTAISSGGQHSCAIVDGGVKCWGFDGDGELGDGTTNDSAVPVEVLGLTSGVVAISAGAYHTCAILNGGNVRCWGYNSNGQLGNNSTTATNAGPPVAVASLSSGATALAAGGYHTCAIVNGAVQCWGYNADGELDSGSSADSHVPVSSSGLGAGVSAISAGEYHACVIISGGALRCWGYNAHGQLGNNTTVSTDAGAPVAVFGITSGASAFAAGGAHSCAVVNGGARCWGSNSLGQLGSGSLQDAHVPVAVSGLSTSVSAVTTGFYHSCAQVTVGAMLETACWGNNTDAEIGLGDQVYQTHPVAVSGITSGASALAPGASASHNCAIISGAVKCWGDNANGQLGNGTTVNSSTPVAVTGLTAGAGAIADGASHSCAVVSGAAKCWGSNAYGQLGNGTTTDSSVPVIAIGSGVTAIAASYWHTCALVGSAVKCWGHNPDGELGDGSTSDSATPMAVTGLSGAATALGAGSAHTCAIVSGGKIQCWGYNSNGQLGNGTTTSTAANPPVSVSSITSGASQIVGGGYHTCAIVNGGAQCWGDGQVGQLGTGLGTDSAIPVAVSGLGSAVSAMTAGEGHTCAIMSGAASCWGSGYYGQLGNGGTDIHLTPFAVSGLSTGVTAIGAANTHTCAIVAGAATCWGTDYYGELGDARRLFVETPATVDQGDQIFTDGFDGY